MKKPVTKKKLLLMGGALLILVAAVVFFSTPWLGEAAPHYLPMPGIQLELNTTPSHFMHTLSVTAHNVDDSQTQFCAPYPELEYYDNGEWHRLQDLFPVNKLDYLEGIDPGKSITLTAKSSVHGYFLRSGHYRAIIITPIMAAREFWDAASVEFDI